MNYQTILKKLISALSYPLKSNEDLELILKAKLTKKEFKLLKALISNSKEEIEKLNFSKDEYSRVESNLKRKLNQERVKHELYKFN